MNKSNPYQSPNSIAHAKSTEDDSKVALPASLGKAILNGLKIGARWSTRIVGPLALCLCAWIGYVIIDQINSGTGPANKPELPLRLAISVGAPLALFLIVTTIASMLGAMFSAIEYLSVKWRRPPRGG